MANRYILTDKGKSARDALLMTLLGERRPTIRVFKARFEKADLEMPDKEPVSTLIGNNENSFPEKAVEKFFKDSIEIIARDYRSSTLTPHLSEFRSIVSLDNYFQLCLNPNRSGERGGWRIPKGPNGWIVPAKKKWDPKLFKRVSEALDCLNCETQIRVFIEAMNRNQYFYSFPVTAPTEITQEWLLKRLVSNLNERAKPRKQPVQTCLINLDSDGIDYASLLNLVLTNLNISIDSYLEESEILSKKNRFIEKICDSSDSLTILVVKNFKVYSDILREFSMDLNIYFNSKQYQNPHPRFIIFCVGESIPSCYESLTEAGDEYFYALEPLIEINKDHIERWILDDAVKHRCLKDICPAKISPIWTNPHTVLNEICKQLGSEILTISKQWE